MPAEQYVLILCADGTLSGCNINLRNLVTMWTVPGRNLPSLQSVCRGLIALPWWSGYTWISSPSATVQGLMSCTAGPLPLQVALE